ncbi:MarR family transcriptional regulator [Oscillospiraceae bacterium HV4-5-C5C]|nr:MarR family transcriptional regulator [Oscillospiraceae bacterium HV4-5-C5C]
MPDYSGAPPAAPRQPSDPDTQLADPVYAALRLDHQLCFPLYAASRKVIALYQPFLQPLGLTYTQYIVLLALWEQDQVLIKQLGDRLHLDNGTLTPVLKRLAEKGLLRRQRLAEDERMVSICLTQQGRALKEAVKDLPQKIEACIQLNSADAAVLYQLLYRILDS